ncbi:MAG: replication factor C large subunit [Methanosarcinaceae archaeon]|nr:replication factor C large subunit [Methanosarcinaceae archaeon]
MASIEWVKKYRPNALSEIVGNKKAVESLKKWAEEWQNGIPDKKGIILHGQAGIGKTSAAHALASDLGWETIEMNASDQRTASIIEKIAGSASQMSSLTGTSSKRLIILDEADNMHGNADRGGKRAIGNIIKNTDQPILLIANDLYSMTTSIRSLCEVVKFNTIQSRSMIPALKNICVEEDIMCGVGVIEKIAEISGGDLRSAVKDLQAAAIGRSEINVEDVTTAERDTKESIFKVLAKIFKSTDPVAALHATYSLDETPEDLIQWIDENLPIQYQEGKEGIDSDIIQGYRNLSRADIYLGRVKKRQNYRLWRYAGILMTCGTVTAKSHIHRGFVKYQPPSIWRKMGQLRAKRNMRDNVASKIGQHCHKPIQQTRIELIKMYGMMLKDEDYAVNVTTNLKLDVDEIVFLTGGKKVTKKIQKIYDSARLQIEETASSDINVFFKTGKNDKGQMKKQTGFDQIPDNATSNAMIDKIGDTSTPTRQKKKPQKTLFDF